MASKKKPHGSQLGLVVSPSRGPSLPPRSIAPSLVDSTKVGDGANDGANVSGESTLVASTLLAADLDLESFDDYDDATRLRLLDPPREVPTVIVEAVGEMYEVSRLRDNGTSSCCVMYSRKELEELKLRIEAALEMA